VLIFSQAEEEEGSLSSHMIKGLLLAYCVLACWVIAFSLAVPWDGRNDPSSFASFFAGRPLNMKLRQLPTRGVVGNVPWTDTYWPSYQSGIAHRWASGQPNDFQYSFYSLEELRNQSAEVTVTLSPAEKYDIFVGRYDYPTVQSEWQRTSPNDPKWEGLCHGWSTAALQYAQPSPVTLKNKDGIEIPFGSSDIKALLTYFIAEYAEQSAQNAFVGERCKFDLQANPDKENVTACSDLNAGAFHVIVSNMMGTAQQGFVGDRDRSIEVWNQPIFQFQSGLTGRRRRPAVGAAPNATQEVHVETKIWFTLEQPPSYEAAPKPRLGTKTYRYWLEVNPEGNIIGGSYSGWDRLDFVWMEKARVPFSGFFQPLQAIYDAATHGQAAAATGAVDLEATARPAAPQLSETLEEPSANFQSCEAGQNYTNNFYARWSIAPMYGPTYIEIQFLDFSTERFHDKVKIYEGADGHGALLGVFHGPTRPQSVLVRASGALVVFITDSSNTDKCLRMRYFASYY